ncbi:MAG TPA: chloride channel protein [Caulobacteraceae bacterium]|jgi:CIC family chloride channel protein|nr:chloride channel protein [Caulobacteraceae bacterium]
MVELPRLQFSSSLGPDLVRAAPAYVRFIRNRVRESEAWLLLTALGIGAAAGVMARLLNFASDWLHEMLFGIPYGERLSALTHPLGWKLVWLPIGGLLLGLFTWLWRKQYPRPIVDPVEANALRGGAMSFRDSLVLAAQTLISNGFGASVGLEAAYAQLGGGLASSLGMKLKTRRTDLRTLVGAGSGASIAAAFGAPLTGAFYAFELIMGSYTVASLAPVVGACLTGYLAERALGGVPSLIEPTQVSLSTSDYLVCAALGLIAAPVGIAIMRLVNLVEATLQRMRVPRLVQPMVGGIAAACLAVWTPEVLASGHGALQNHLTHPGELWPVSADFLLKAGASIICLGCGFRGGLFFASLMLGALLGQMYWFTLVLAGAPQIPDMTVTALVGMAALAAGVVGGPLTMSFLVLETTGDIKLAGATLAATLMCSLVVRRFFGYSFSTWRFHLRGETIRSAHDVGRIRSLTAGKMMRQNPPTALASITLAEFRRRHPLGSTPRVVLLDNEGRYAGIVLTADAFAPDRDEAAHAGALAINRALALRADTNVKDAMRAFESSHSDELAVVDGQGAVLGLLTETYAARRYAEELEKTRQELVGES